MDELVSEGNMGLYEAVKQFDESRGLKFITFAVWWIRKAIQSALAHHGKIAPPPLGRVGDLWRVERRAAKLAHEPGRAATDREIIDNLELSDGRARNALKIRQHDVSLDAPAYRNGEPSLIDTFQTEQEDASQILETKEKTEFIEDCLEILSARERQVLSSHFGLDGGQQMSLSRIGRSMGISRERVRFAQSSAQGNRITLSREEYGHG